VSIHSCRLSGSLEIPTISSGNNRVFNKKSVLKFEHQEKHIGSLW
jgi:hypothetical protein